MRLDPGDPHLLAKAAALQPYLAQIWTKIKVEVYYHPEILQRQLQGSVSLQIRIDKWGRLLHINEATLTGRPELAGWVVHGVTEALKDGFLRQPMAQPAELFLRFQFSIASSPPPQAELNAQGNVLLFGINGYVPPFLAAQQKVSRAPDGTVILHRERWDFFERLKMYAEACDLRKAEGGCVQAAELYAKINKMERVREYHRKACNLGIVESCQKGI